MSEFEVIKYIGTPIALSAFLMAIIAKSYHNKLNFKIQLLKEIPETDRAAILDKELETYRISSENDNLTRNQKYELMQSVLLHRAKRFKIVAIATIILAVIVFGTILISVYLERQVQAEVLEANTREKKVKQTANNGHNIYQEKGNIVLNEKDNPTLIMNDLNIENDNKNTIEIGFEKNYLNRFYKIVTFTLSNPRERGIIIVNNIELEIMRAEPFIIAISQRTRAGHHLYTNLK